MLDNYKSVRFNGAATTTFKSGSGKLGYITINTPITSGTITVYDSLTATGTIVAGITSGATGSTPVTLVYLSTVQTGITVVSVGALLDFTVTFS